MILICKRCIPIVVDVAWKKFYVNDANVFWYIVHTIQNAYLKRNNTNAKDKDFIFLDREHVGEATWSKNSKCKILSFRAHFSWRQSYMYVYILLSKARQRNSKLSKLSAYIAAAVIWLKYCRYSVKLIQSSENMKNGRKI